MEDWLRLLFMIGVALSFYQTKAAYVQENGNRSNYSSVNLEKTDVRMFIEAYNDGHFRSYDGQYSWIKYYHHMGRNYYVNHTGFEAVENDTSRQLCVFSSKTMENRLVDELSLNEDMWRFETIKFYCPRSMSCCNLTCCSRALPWWITITIVAVCMGLLALIIYGVGRGFKTYEKRRPPTRKDTVLLEEKHMLEPR